MKIQRHLGPSPPLVRYEPILFENGWKITDSDDDSLVAQKAIGQSRFPVTSATTWVLALETQGEEDQKVRATLEVPAFTESTYAIKRMQDKLLDIASDVEGACEVSDEIEIDVLHELRARGPGGGSTPG